MSGGCLYSTKVNIKILLFPRSMTIIQYGMDRTKKNIQLFGLRTLSLARSLAHAFFNTYRVTWAVIHIQFVEQGERQMCYLIRVKHINHHHSTSIHISETELIRKIHKTRAFRLFDFRFLCGLWRSCVYSVVKSCYYMCVCMWGEEIIYVVSTRTSSNKNVKINR